MDEPNKRGEVSRAAVEEARVSLDSQIDRISKTGDESFRLIKLSITLLIGILGAVPASEQFGIEIGELVNIYTGSGTLFLFFTLIGAVISYLSTSFVAGLSRDAIETIEDSDIDINEY